MNVSAATGSACIRGGRGPRAIATVATAATVGILFAACGAGAVDTATTTSALATHSETTTSSTPTPTLRTATPPVSVATVTSNPSATTVPRTPTAVVRRAAGTYTRAQIPWDQVGSGWTGVVVVPIPTSAATGLGALPGTLYLVSPEGARYAIGATAPGDLVTDVTPDGRQVLTRHKAGTREAVTQVWDAQTGVARTVATGMENGRFSRPRGSAVIGTVLGADGAAHLQRYGLDGRLQLTYPMPEGGGVPTFVVRPPDGLTVVVQTHAGVTVLGNATGATLRTIPTPSGASFCWPASMWTRTQVLVACASTASGGSASDLYTVPVSSGPMTRMALAEGQDADGRYGFGFVGAWHSTVGVLLQRGAGCGNGGYAMLHTDGRVTDLRFPEKSTAEGGPAVLGVVGPTALLSVTSGEGNCGGGRYESLVSHDLATGASHPLVGPLAGTGALLGTPVVLEPAP